MKKRIVFLLTALVLVTSIIVTGCAGASKAPSKGGVITIGLGTPLSGVAAGWGIPQLRATEMFFDKVNAEGGVTVQGKKYTFEVIGYDTKWDAAEGAIIANRLAYEDGALIVSGCGGPAAVAAIPVYEEAGTVLNYDMPYARRFPNANTPLLFAPFPRYGEAQSGYWPWLVAKFGIQKAAHVGANYEEGYFSEDMMNIYAPKAGVEVTAAELVEFGTVDFTPTAMKLLAGDPGMVYIGGAPPDIAGGITRDLRALGYEGLMGYVYSPNLDVVRDIAGAEAAEGFMGMGTFGEPLSPQQISIRNEYIARYGQAEWTTTVLLFYTAWETIPVAIEQAQSLEPSDIADALRLGMFETDAAGQVWYGGEEFYEGMGNQILYRMPVSQLQNGVAVLVDYITPGNY